MSCEKNNGHFSSQSLVYPGDSYFLKDSQIRNVKTLNSKKKKIEVLVHHEDSDFDLSKYSLLISISGTVYLGKFKNKIIIDEFSYEEGYEFEYITVQIIDGEKKKSWIYGEKESYNLSNAKIIDIVLLESKESDNMKVLLRPN